MSEDTIKQRRWGSILSAVPPSQPTQSSNVKPLRKWADLEAAIHKARNYLVHAQAEEHKCENALAEARERKTEAQLIISRLEDEWREQSRTVLGVDIDAGQS